MDLRQFFATLRRRWVFQVVTFVAGVAATIVIVLSMTPQYGSQAKVFISTPSGGQAEYAASFIVTQRVASYADLATDPSVLDGAAQRLGFPMTGSELASHVKAEVVTSTQTIQLDAKADTPERAQAMVGAVADELVAVVKRLERPTDSSEAPAIAARIAGEPSLSSSPVSPNIPLNLAAGVLISLFVALTGALVRDLLDRTVKGRHDIERMTTATILGTLPFTNEVKKEPLSAETGGSLAEAFRVLRTNLQFVKIDAERQAILVSSALPNEGKTLVATNLALSMAQSGKSVLLIDADMRNPNVADLLNLENSVGVMTVLIGRTTFDQALQSHVSGISFMGSGPMPPNPAEVLESQAMRDMLARAKREFDVVIIDAPPMLPVADASILLTEVDGVLLLVRHGSTTREQLRLALARIETVGGSILGLVLNRTPRRAADTDGYGYGYGHGYGYGYAAPATTKETSRKSDVVASAGRRVKR
ncbi:MAG: polysaccharide biosynthesis tyrosine autokinase [Aeromicrobium erythreum]